MSVGSGLPSLRAVLKDSVFLLLAAPLFSSLLAAGLEGTAYPQVKRFGGQVKNAWV